MRIGRWLGIVASCAVAAGGLLTDTTTGRAASGAGDQAVAYQINVAHSGSLSGDTLTPPLVKGWSRSDLGGTVSYPLIAGGKVFVTVGGPYTSTSGSKPTKWIYALDEATGATVWSHTIGGTYDFVNAAYDSGTVYVLNFDGLLQSFNADTGAPGWSLQLPGQYDFTSPPTAANGAVYAVGEGSGGTVYAVNDSTGTILWGLGGLDTGGHSSPALSSNGVFVSGTCDVYAFSQTVPTGASPLLWDKSYGCTGGGGKTPVLGPGGLYVRQEGVPSSNDILDPVTDAVLGHFTAGPAPAFINGTGYFLSGGTLRAVGSSGNVLWSFAGDGGLNTAPIVVNNDVYVGSSTGMLYAVDVASGQSVWNTNVGAGIQAPDEQNATLTTGLGAGEGHLVVPAGNTLTAFTPANSDTTPPVISPTVSGSPGSNGWYLGPVTVSWNVSDGETGIVSSTGCISSTLSTDTPGTTLTCSATNGGGLTSSSSVTIKIDSAAPTLSCSTPPVGWSGSDVTVTCSASDGGSGLANSNDGNFTLSTNVLSGSESSSAATPSRTVCDGAGNCAAAGPYTGLKVDKRPPSISVTAPTAATYTLNGSVNAAYSCSDAGSGVVSCSGTAPSGGTVATSSVGNKTFTVNSVDAVGNIAAPQSISYTVTYGVCQSSIPNIKSGHNGNVSVQLCDAKGANVSTAATGLTATGIYTNAGTLVRTLNNSFSYTNSLNNSGAGYTESVSTTGLASGSYYVAFKATGDPVSHSASFSVK